MGALWGHNIAPLDPPAKTMYFSEKHYEFVPTQNKYANIRVELKIVI